MPDVLTELVVVNIGSECGPGLTVEYQTLVIDGTWGVLGLVTHPALPVSEPAGGHTVPVSLVTQVLLVQQLELLQLELLLPGLQPLLLLAPGKYLEVGAYCRCTLKGQKNKVYFFLSFQLGNEYCATISITYIY